MVYLLFKCHFVVWLPPITLKIPLLCFVLINSVLLNLLCVKKRKEKKRTLFWFTSSGALHTRNHLKNKQWEKQIINYEKNKQQWEKQITNHDKNKQREKQIIKHEKKKYIYKKWEKQITKHEKNESLHTNEVTHAHTHKLRHPITITLQTCTYRGHSSSILQ